jgi:hypothetical protein
MKKLAFNIVLSFSVLCANCQYIYFNKRYDINDQADLSRGITEVDGGFIIAGGTDPANIFTKFIDSVGNKKWEKIYQFPNWAWSYFGFVGALIKTKDNNIAIAGQLKADTNYAESLLMKINISGDTL